MYSSLGMRAGNAKAGDDGKRRLFFDLYNL